MTTLLQVKDAFKSYGSRAIFEGAGFAVGAGEHVGVIGPNGAGKTTLFRALTGEEDLDRGEIARSRELRLGYLAQHEDAELNRTVAEYITRGSLTPEWELRSLGRGLGLANELFDRPVAELSAGYRMRVKLLKLLGERPNLMLLDEPTNYLDLETLLVLENFLQSFDGAFLLISHDREFLRRTTDHILEVEGGEITKYPGSLDDYFEYKDTLRRQLEAQAMSQEARRREVLDFVARFGAKASKAKQAQSRLRSLDRMDKVEIKPLAVRAKIRIPDPDRVPKQALHLENLTVGYPGRRVLEDVSWDLVGGDRVGVVGLNGAGKTTLLKTLAGKLTPLSGKIERGFGLTWSIYGSEAAESLDESKTVLQSLVDAAPSDTPLQDINDMAGALLFSGGDMAKKVEVLSGGERSRVALGAVLLQRSSCLLLDEPTNHLDFYTVEAMGEALRGFKGSVVLVSHDRSFIARVSNRILEVSNGKARLYPGDYDDYVWSLSKGVLAERVATPTSESPRGTAADGAAKATGEKVGGGALRERWAAIDKRVRQIRKRLDELTTAIDKHHAEQSRLNDELASLPGGDPKMNELSRALGAAGAALVACETEWLELADEESKLREERGA